MVLNVVQFILFVELAHRMPAAKENLLLKISDYIAFKYAKYLEEYGRRETWEETVERNAAMHLKKFQEYSDICEEIKWVYDNFVKPKKLVPSARSLQYAGRPIEENPARMYNCCFLAVDELRSFWDLVFLLMSGCGVGFSVEKHHIEKLPKIVRPTSEATFVVPDTKEGWADAFKELISSYFGLNPKPIFDYSLIRPAGAPLKTSGGTASGPRVLQKAMLKIDAILSQTNTGDSLTSLQCYDIICHQARCVQAGGSRRSSLICLFDPTDIALLKCKEVITKETKHRCASNNSAVFYRDSTTEEQFKKFWEYASTQRTGEPGIFWSNSKKTGTNPCVEVGLFRWQFCCLCDVNGSTVISQQDLEERCAAAAFIATLQASYTNFKYISPTWKEQTEKEALIGVGITGICSGPMASLDIRAAAEVVKKTNERVARRIGINISPRCTVVKPAGTTSLLFGCSSGVHPWYAQTFRRRITVTHTEPLYHHLKSQVPDALEVQEHNSAQSWLNFPAVAPPNSITRHESLKNMLDRVRRWNIEWIGGGHRSGTLHNNVSATIYLGDDEEWKTFGKWAWENRMIYNGVATFPKFISTFKQTPNEDCTWEEIEEMAERLAGLDLSQFKESQDNTNFMAEPACTSESCEIPVRQRVQIEQVSV